ncbi:cation:proton antiporter [Dactylosporangium roseum]|uniref:Cation:proton antiporter n=1 Tax=Dactylosporangium roseum TaxID=47989 RepID=A0ABY5ZFS3_9ACTN|nr:cation:proton antiporter [Dactylosporangium roseum]UWZ39597.1 cation:proton antiporter [Dactylosporangium roseum]
MLADLTRTERPPLMRRPGRVVAAAAVLSVAAVAAIVLILRQVGGPSQAGGGPHPGTPLYLRVFAAVLVIGAVAAAGGLLARKCRQPAVVGEIAAGLLLGPSVLGRLLPGVSAALLPKDVRGVLDLIAQASLILFMFAVGAAFDAGALRRQGAAVGMLSQATMLVPFALGLLIVPLLYPSLAGEGVGTVAFAIFIGTAISITAFPVLARIVEDTGLARTPLGNLAMVCAGINDVLAWCALAAVMAVISAGSPLGVLVTVPLVAAVTAVLLLVVRPLLQRAANRLEGVEASAALRVTVVLCLVFALAGLTDRLGVHPILGAFLAGVILPRDARFLAGVPDRLGTLNRALLLPIFFASVGLSVNIGGIAGEPSLLLLGALILLVAVGGKLVTAAACARAGGLPWRASVGLGVLLNARGITEIVVLRTGLDIGVINTTAFTLLVVMALVTTAMAAPLLRRLGVSQKPDMVPNPP